MSSGRPPIEGWVDPNFPNPGGENDAPIIIYGYTPSFALCIAGIVLFFLSLTVHSWQVWRYRAWYFLPLTFACLMEVVGYAFRSLSAKKNPYDVISFVVQYFFIVTAPVFISASIYVCLSRLIDWSRSPDFTTGRSRWLRPKLILWVFITADVVATITQIAGAALIGVSQTKRKDPTTANNILLGGLAFQTAAFAIYFILFLIFTVSLIRDPQFRKALGSKSQFFFALFLASVLVFLRTCFRLAETAEGLLQELSTNEVYFITLEFVPIVLTVWILAIWHPGRFLPNTPRKVKSNTSTDEMRQTSAV